MTVELCLLAGLGWKLRSISGFTFSLVSNLPLFTTPFLSFYLEKRYHLDSTLAGRDVCFCFYMDGYFVAASYVTYAMYLVLIPTYHLFSKTLRFCFNEICNGLCLGAFARQGWSLCVCVWGNEPRLDLNRPDEVAECIFGYIHRQSVMMYHA